jgi:hypothetical protein
LSDDVPRVVATQPIVPISVRVRGLATPLRFRLTLVGLGLDPRFQMVHWNPYGAAALREVARWAEQEGEP